MARIKTISSFILSHYYIFILSWTLIIVSFATHQQLMQKDNSGIKVEQIRKGSPNLIPSPLPSVKIQIMGGKVCLRC